MPYPAPTRVSDVWSKDDYAELSKYIEQKVKSIDSRLENFRNEKLPEYVRLYQGVPKEQETSFPWPGAANLVIQLIGTFCDELLSRVIGSTFMYDPLFAVTLDGDNPEATGQEEKRVLEKFLMDEAYDPEALDLYRVENAFYNSAIKYGTGVLAFPWEYVVQKNYVYISGGDTKNSKVNSTFNPVIKRDGPHPEIVPLNKFGIDPRIPSLGNADFFYTIETLDWWRTKNLPETDNLIDSEVMSAIAENPDRLESDEMQKAATSELSLSDATAHGGAEFDFYKCYLTYQKGNETYSILAKYHKKSRTLLYAVFNIYPENIFPVEDVKLSYDEENYFGRGYAQMLRSYQKELSQNSNWRTNNRNMAMLQLLRVDPQSKLSSILQVYPGCLIPAKEGEVEVLKQGADIGYNDSADQFIMACAKERAGVDPAIGGTGGGLVNNKRGIYSASGTSMMLMQQNNRNNLRLGDMRAAHIRLAIKLMHMYSSFGITTKLKKYGDRAETLKNAFQSFKDETLGFRFRPASASNNRELERQNDIMLAGAMSRFYQESAQMIQALSQPNIPPALSEFYQDALLANTSLFRTILRNFNHDERLLPKTPSQEGKNGKSNAASGKAIQSQGAVPTGPVSNPGAVPDSIQGGKVL